MAYSLRKRPSVATPGKKIIDIRKEKVQMKRKAIAVTSLVFSGALVIGTGTGWSQSGTGSGSSRSQSGTGPGSSGSQSGTGSSSSGSQSGMQRSRSGSSGMDTHASGQWSREDIRRVQEALKDKGHN